MNMSAEHQNRMASVIIPVYNGEAFLERALKSAFEQDYRPLEVIVIDDGSTDATARIAQSRPDVRYFYQPNRGHGTAKNAGIEKARGEFLAFLDADDWWTPNKLRVQIECLDAHPEIGYALSHMRVIVEPGIEAPAWIRPELLKQASPAMLPSALVVRRAVLSLVGGFDPAFRIGNDSDWFFRAQDLGIQRMILPEVLLYKGLHSSNDSNRVDISRGDMLRLIRASIRRKRSGTK